MQNLFSCITRGVLIPSAIIIALTGCQATPPASFLPSTPVTLSLSGNVHGGQQPVANSFVELYTVGTTADGAPSTPLISNGVLTDANGNFSITGTYSCSGAGYVYISATGGQPLSGTTNPDLALMTALGPCSALTSSTFITVNEVTTVAAVAALAPYMRSITSIGSGTADLANLKSAFTTAGQYASSSGGMSPGAGVPAGFTVPNALINTLADILAACVNTSGGGAGDGTACGNLFDNATRAGAGEPTNTTSAMLNIMLYPSANTSALYSLVQPAAPFQPTLTQAPADFRPHLMPAIANASPLQVSTSSLTFAGSTIGATTASQTITLTNQTAQSTTLGTPLLLGGNPADFTISNGCGAALGGGASCTVTVSARPSAGGLRTAFLQFASSSPDTPQNVALTANGLRVNPGNVVVSGNQFMRDGVVFTPHGLNFIAFVQAPAAQPTGCASSPTSNNFQNAYFRYYNEGSTLFADLAAWGADTIRFQVSQPGLDSQDPNGLYSKVFFNGFVQAVRSARAAGLNVVVSLQDECQSGDPATANYPNAATQRVWNELAPLLKNDLGILFEIYNEPEPLPNTANWQTWQSDFNPVIAAIRSAGATNVVLADGLNFAQSFSGALPLTDTAGETAYAVHAYFHQANLTNANFDTNFGNWAAGHPMLATDWAAVGNSATSGSSYYCDSSTGQQSVLLLTYLQSHGIGMLGFTWDFTGQLFGSMVYYTNGTSTTELTSTFAGKACGDNGFGSGLEMQQWFQTGTVPQTPQ